MHVLPGRALAGLRLLILLVLPPPSLPSRDLSTGRMQRFAPKRVPAPQRRFAWAFCARARQGMGGNSGPGFGIGHAWVQCGGIAQQHISTALWRPLAQPAQGGDPAGFEDEFWFFLRIVNSMADSGPCPNQSCLQDVWCDMAHHLMFSPIVLSSALALVLCLDALCRHRRPLAASVGCGVSSALRLFPLFSLSLSLSSFSPQGDKEGWVEYHRRRRARALRNRLRRLRFCLGPGERGRPFFVRARRSPP